MRDLFSDLQQEAKKLPPEETTPADTVIDIEGAEDGEVAPSDTPLMTDFFAGVKNVRDTLSSMEELIAQVDERHAALLVAYNSAGTKEAQDNLTALMDQISATGKRVRKDLKAMEAENKDIASKIAQGKFKEEESNANVQLRIRESQHSSLSKKFVKVMTDYNDIQAENKRKYKESITRQCKLVDPDITEDQVDGIIENGAGGIFSGKNLNEAEQALNDIRDRHQDIIRLERSLFELHEMFLDLAVLVESQGEMIDRIEFSVESSYEYIEKGRRNVTLARAYQSKTRSKKVCLIVAGLICAGLIVIIILGITVKK